MPSFISPVDSTHLFYRDYVPAEAAHRPRNRAAPNMALVCLHGWPSTQLPDTKKNPFLARNFKSMTPRRLTFSLFLILVHSRLCRRRKILTRDVEVSSKMWEHLLVPLCETHRLRCIAPDRRGFGRSDWNSPDSARCIDYNTFTADVIGLLEYLKVDAIVFLAASMGTAESLLVYLQSPFVQKRCKVSHSARDLLHYCSSAFVSDSLLGIHLGSTEHAISAPGRSLSTAFDSWMGATKGR